MCAVSGLPHWRKEVTRLQLQLQLHFQVTSSSPEQRWSRTVGAAGDHAGFGSTVGWGWPTGRVRSDTGRSS